MTTTNAIWMGVAVLSLACASNQVRPESESAAAHHADAAHERAEADAQRRQYDPKRTEEQTIAGPGGTSEAITVDSAPYNPTEWHLHKADALTSHARAHESAAAQLQSFEAEECRGVSRGARAACPFTGPIARVDDIDGGVRMIFVDASQVDSVVAQMRCHFAWARARGFTQLPDCPIYIKGIDIHRSSDGRGIDITARDRDVITLVRQRTHGG